MAGLGTGNSPDDLLSRMNEKLMTMSKGQRKLATYISRNYDKAVFMTAAKMGDEVGVSAPKPPLREGVGGGFILSLLLPIM